MVKIKIILIALLLIPVLNGAGIFAQTDQYGDAKILEAGDSTYKTKFSLSAGTYSLFRVSVENPHATLTDSIKIFHISNRMIYNSDTVKADTTPVRYKMLSDTGKSIQNDTAYQLLIVPAGESREIFIYYPNPDNLYFAIVNAVYNTGRKAYLKIRGFNR